MSARPPPPRSAPSPKSPDDSGPTVLRETSRSRQVTTVHLPPPAKTPEQRAVRNALLGLGAFTLLMALALAAWFARADTPWGIASFIAFMSTLGGATATAQMWRKPARPSAHIGLGVMAFSLLRVVFATEWNTSSVVILTVTALLAIPVAQAALALPRT